MRKRFKMAPIVVGCLLSLFAATTANADANCRSDFTVSEPYGGSGKDLENFSDDLLTAYVLGFLKGVSFSTAFGANAECIQMQFACTEKMPLGELVANVRKWLPAVNARAIPTSAGEAVFMTFQRFCGSDQ